MSEDQSGENGRNKKKKELHKQRQKCKAIGKNHKLQETGHHLCI